MQMLFYAHSGLRYLVLLVGLVALVYLGYSAITRSGSERAGRVVGSVFVGVLDLQILLGVGMVVMGLYYGALIGHMFMMVAAAVIAHVAMVMAKNAEPTSRRAWMRFGGVLVALVLIAGGIMSIGRSIFGSGEPTMLG